MSGREKRLWVTAAALVGLIYSTLYIVRGPVEALRGRGLLASVVGAVFLLAALGLGWLLWRRRPGPLELSVLAFFTALLVAFAWATERPEERLHLLEYGALGGLVYLALVERSRARRSAGPERGGRVGPGVALAAIAVSGLCGWVDEGIQYLLPNRVYDLRDVGLNMVAAALSVGALHSMALARRRDRR